MQRVKLAAGVVCAAVLAAPMAHAAERPPQKVDNGVLVPLAGATLKVEVCTDSVVRIAYAGDAAVFDRPSMVTAPKQCGGATWRATIGDVSVVVQTVKLRVTVSRATGRVRFTDPRGVPILSEASRGQGARRDGHAIAVPSGATLDRMSVTGPKALVDQLEYAVGAFHRLPRIPSLALRIARVADGSVDVTLVSSNAHDWDLAAADLILHEAGGRLAGFDGARPAYNQPDPVHGELVAASRALHPQVIGAMTTRRAASARR